MRLTAYFATDRIFSHRIPALYLMAYNNDYPPKVLQGKCGNEVVVVKEELRKCS